MSLSLNTTLVPSRSHQNLTSPDNYHPSQTGILHNPQFNKGTAFTEDERSLLGIRGLLPPHVETIDQQLKRAYRQFSAFNTPLEKYIYLSSLQDRNETLFFKLLVENPVETMPIVYTPTVGEACTKFDEVFRAPRGMYISLKDKGVIRQVLDNWERTPEIIVVTDGSRILGLGDLGANGMGIPIGKLSLYVAGAGFHPAATLPICLDVGTNNKRYIEDELYLGLKQERVRGEQFFEFMDEFLMAVKDKWPKCLLQFEDFSNDVCFTLLDKYRDRMLCFNDDIQGTGAVIVSGFLNTCKLTGVRPKDNKLVFFGAGSAAVGVADQIAGVMKIDAEQDGEKVTVEDMKKNIYLVDSKGLVTKHRGDKLDVHKIPYAREDVTEKIPKLVDVVALVKPTVLIGLSGQGSTFTEDVITELAKHNKKPAIFALSNPTANSECTAEQAVRWTNGTCVFASGSPFPVVEYEGRTIIPGQGNNMYIFPGLGLGAVVSEAKHVSDVMILVASQTLADCVTEEMLQKGLIYPGLNEIRKISAKIAVAVAKQAVKEGLSTVTDVNWEQAVSEYIYEPAYSGLYNLTPAKSHTN